MQSTKRLLTNIKTVDMIHSVIVCHHKSSSKVDFISFSKCHSLYCIRMITNESNHHLTVFANAQ